MPSGTSVEPPQAAAVVEWPADWLRGALSVCVLHLLSDGPTYGYALASRLEDLGLGTIKGGTLYPLLGRLEGAGFVEVEWKAGTSGPGRKYFALTPSGRDAALQQAEAWRTFAHLTTALLDRTDSNPTSLGGTA